MPVEEVDELISCPPNEQCHCGGNIIQDIDVKRRHQQYEFPVIKPVVTEYQIYGGACNCCNKKHPGKLPEDVSFSLLGPRATAMTAHLSGTYCISKQNIVNMYQDIFNFTLSTGMVCKAEKTAGTCRNILLHQPALWQFLETDGIEPTNNLAEQMIRTLAIWRKTSFGTQSEAGTLYMERIMTVVATCKLQKKNILSYLTDTVKSYVCKTKAPSLLTNLLEQQEPELQLAA